MKRVEVKSRATHGRQGSARLNLRFELLDAAVEYLEPRFEDFGAPLFVILLGTPTYANSSPTRVCEVTQVVRTRPEALDQERNGRVIPRIAGMLVDGTSGEEIFPLFSLSSK